MVRQSQKNKRGGRGYTDDELTASKRPNVNMAASASESQEVQELSELTEVHRTPTLTDIHKIYRKYKIQRTTFRGSLENLNPPSRNKKLNYKMQKRR